MEFENGRTGYIYKIVNIGQLDKVLYIGSTFDPKNRKYYHKYHCKTPSQRSYNCSLYKHIRSHGGWVNFKFQIIIEYVCKDKRELKAKEHEYIDIYGLENLLNTLSAFKSDDDKKAYHKQYHIKHKDKHKEYSRKRYQQNRQRILEKSKQMKGVKTICCCGQIVNKNGLSGHRKSKTHIDKIENYPDLTFEEYVLQRKKACRQRKKEYHQKYYLLHK